MTKTECSVCARASLDATGEGLAVERQVQACRELAAKLGFTVTRVYVYVDASVSGRAA